MQKGKQIKCGRNNEIFVLALFKKSVILANGQSPRPVHLNTNGKVAQQESVIAAMMDTQPGSSPLQF